VPRPRSASSRVDPKPEPLDAAEIQERLLDQIADGAKLLKAIEPQLRAHPAPAIDTIIQLYRVLVLKISGEVQDHPQLLALLNSLNRSVMDWERLEEKRKDRELEQQRYREQQAARQKEQPSRAGALHPETVEKIERELQLF